MIIFKHLKYYSVVIILLSLVLNSCQEKVEEAPKSSLELRDNLLYKVGSDKPFTGRERALVKGKIIEYDVKDGLKHGEFKVFFENGNIEMQGQIDSNRNVGKWQYFYEDGNIESEGNFDFDKPNGKWIWYYPDGTKREEGNYNNGIQVGTWFEFDSTGTVISEHEYEMGESSKDSSDT
jgi:MORN repeat variant